MLSQNLFVRDPRELPFLETELRKVLLLSDSRTRGIRVREDDNFGFMVMQFVYKQMQHAESVLLLIPRRDAGLIARTMVEGLIQLLWASHAPEERATLWRSFAVIHDWRLLRGRLKEGIPVGDVDFEQTEERLKVFGPLHQIRSTKPSAADPYYRSWRGSVTLSDMASIVGRALYDGPYAELSDWEHWGVSGIGDSMSRHLDRITVNPHSDRVTGLSLLAATQALLQTLEVANVHLQLDLGEELRVTTEHLIATLTYFEGSAKSQ